MSKYPKDYRVAATWCLNYNAGDMLTPYLIEKITGRPPIYYDRGQEGMILVGAGSIANWAVQDNIVWGAGIANMRDGCSSFAKYCAVRGPITRAMVLACGGDCPEVFGDPGLLLPRFLRPERCGLGPAIVPHYVDLARVHEMYAKQKIGIVSPLQSIEDFVGHIASSSIVFSSSLHGLVVADAYGVPNVWVNFGGSLSGDGTKFRDYMMSVGRPIYCVDGTEAPIGWSLWQQSPPPVPDVSKVAEGLWDSCPFKDGPL